MYEDTFHAIGQTDATNAQKSLSLFSKDAYERLAFVGSSAVTCMRSKTENGIDRFDLGSKCFVEIMKSHVNHGEICKQQNKIYFYRGLEEGCSRPK